jgi:hypothetical protein
MAGVVAAICGIAVFAGRAGATASAVLPPELRLGNDTGQVVDAGQAREITTALWPLREQGLASDDVATTDRLEDGVAREFDDAVSIDDRARPNITPLRRVRPYSNLTVFVPHQTTYPAAFLAQVLTSVYATVPSEGSVAGAPYVELVVITRHDRSSSWKVSLDTGYAATTLQLPSTGADGLGTDPPPSFIDPPALFSGLAGYWQHWKDTGTPPADAELWLPGYWTTQRAAKLASVRNRSADPGCGGCIRNVGYRADPATDGIWSFAVSRPDGTPARLVCSTVRITDRSVPGRRQLALHQDGARNNWGGWLAPGVYSAITTSAVRQSCIKTGPARQDGLAILGGNGDIVAAHATRASPALIFHLRLPFGVAAALGVGLAMVLALAIVQTRLRRLTTGTVGSPPPLPTPPWPAPTPGWATGGAPFTMATTSPGQGSGEQDHTWRRAARMRRWSLGLSVALSVAGTAIPFGLMTHSALVGVGLAVAFGAFLAWLAVASRRQAERRLNVSAAGTLSVNGLLDFSCLPEPWPAQSRETLSAAAAPRAPGLSVTLAVTDGYLTVERRRVALTGTTPFTARVALSAIRDVHVGPAQLTLNGSSLSFDLASGEQLRVDLGVGTASAQRVAAGIDEAKRQAASRPLPSSPGIEVTSPPPPLRTPAATAGLLMMAFLPPWALAMIGAHNGPFAAAALTGGLFVALALTIKRPPSMASVLARAMAVGAGAFAVDAVRLGQPVRLTGAAICVLLAAWLARQSPTRDTAQPTSLPR